MTNLIETKAPEKIELKKISEGYYRHDSKGHRIVIRKWNKLRLADLYTDAEFNSDYEWEAGWECKTKKEAIACVKGYFGK